MNRTVSLTTSALAALTLLASAGHVGAETAQAKACASKATAQHLQGAGRTTFERACMKGTAAPDRPTAPTEPSRKAQAITAPSGEDRTVRSKACSAEADRRHLTGSDRNAFRLSCIATAGPVTEAQTKTQAPKPAHALPGIGVNGDKPST